MPKAPGASRRRGGHQQYMPSLSSVRDGGKGGLPAALLCASGATSPGGGPMPLLGCNAGIRGSGSGTGGTGTESASLRTAPNSEVRWPPLPLSPHAHHLDPAAGSLPESWGCSFTTQSQHAGSHLQQSLHHVSIPHLTTPNPHTSPLLPDLHACQASPLNAHLLAPPHP